MQWHRLAEENEALIFSYFVGAGAGDDDLNLMPHTDEVLPQTGDMLINPAGV
jgi:hypothetical protein